MDALGKITRTVELVRLEGQRGGHLRGIKVQKVQKTDEKNKFLI